MTAEYSPDGAGCTLAFPWWREGTDWAVKKLPELAAPVITVMVPVRYITDAADDVSALAREVQDAPLGLFRDIASAVQRPASPAYPAADA